MQQLFTRTAIAVLLAAIAVALAPAVAGAQSGADYRLHKSGLCVRPSEAEGLMYDILIERVNKQRHRRRCAVANVSPRRNIAALAWQEPGTKPIHVITAQSRRYPKGGEHPLRPARHAEYRLIKLLRRMRIPLDWRLGAAAAHASRRLLRAPAAQPPAQPARLLPRARGRSRSGSAP